MQTEIFIRWTLPFFRLVEYTSRHQKRFSRLFCRKQSIAHAHFCKTYPRSHRTTLFSLSCALLNTQGTIYDILLSLVQQIKKTKPSWIISVQSIAEHSLSLSCASLSLQGTIYDILPMQSQQIKKTKPSRIMSELWNCQNYIILMKNKDSSKCKKR